MRKAYAAFMAERVRDRYGRPRYDGDPGGFPSVPERDFVTSADAWQEAIDYFAQDLPFHAHEVFEQRWRCCPVEERVLWQSLAQLAAAETHRARGNAVGAHRLALRAQEKFQQVAEVPDPVDLAYVMEALSMLLDDEMPSTD